MYHDFRLGTVLDSGFEIPHATLHLPDGTRKPNGDIGMAGHALNQFVHIGNDVVSPPGLVEISGISPQTTRLFN
jgi:hypothetical protein